MRGSPRVALRFTRGYRPAPLRGGDFGAIAVGCAPRPVGARRPSTRRHRSSMPRLLTPVAGPLPHLKNVQRVVLTRARQGMVIVVPEGDAGDLTRAAGFYDGTFEYLRGLGLPVVGE